MPRTSTMSDYCQATDDFGFELGSFQATYVITVDSDDERFAQMLQDETAADAAALQRAEQLAPRGEALERLLQRFPAPQEWWDEEE